MSSGSSSEESPQLVVTYSEIVTDSGTLRASVESLKNKNSSGATLVRDQVKEISRLPNELNRNREKRYFLETFMNYLELYNRCMNQLMGIEKNLYKDHNESDENDFETIINKTEDIIKNIQNDPLIVTPLPHTAACESEVGGQTTFEKAKFEILGRYEDYLKDAESVFSTAGIL